MKKVNLLSFNWLLVYAIALYFVGVFFTEPQNVDELKELGLADQEQYTYMDSSGDEHEGETLINIDGIGFVLTYRDIYLAPILFLGFSCLLAQLLFNSTDELRCIIFTNCIIGLFLIFLTKKPNVVSTVFYWSGIVVASFALHKDD